MKMKRFIHIFTLVTFVMVSFILIACNKKTITLSVNELAFETEKKTEYIESMYLTDYITELNDEETVKFALEGNSNKMGKTYKGIAISSFYTTKVNGMDCYTYMIMTAETNPHSVVFLDVSEDMFENGKKMTIEIESKEDVEKATIIPLKHNIEPVVMDNKITFEISDYGIYTMIKDDISKPDKAYTIYVRKPEKVEVPYGYTLIEYKPGIHFIDPIQLKSNTVLYLHQGALLIAKDPARITESNAFIYSEGAKDIKVLGHGLIDMSQVSWHGGRGISLTSCENIEIKGPTIINSSTWTSVYKYCKNMTIEDMIIFGYRQNSDGYAVCSCEDVLVKNCFARSGDDLFEVKTYSGMEAKNVTFEGCVAWPDNCRGFGIVQETYSNISNVIYKDCSLLYQLKDWSEKMASFVITAGEAGSVENVTFDNCDMFYSKVIAVRMSVGANDETMGVTNFINTIKNITFKDCKFLYPTSGNGIVKFRNRTTDKNAISDITFDNCYFKDMLLEDINSIKPVLEGISEDDFDFVIVRK